MAESKNNMLRGVLLLAGVAVVAALVLEIVRVGPPPLINIRPAVPVIGKRTAVTIELSEPSRGLSHVKVELQQGDRVESLAEKNYELPYALSFWAPVRPRTRSAFKWVVRPSAD